MSEASKPKTLSPNLFPVVGIGASAGGLDAFKKLLKAIPENSGIAYVLVQHLDPTHESGIGLAIVKKIVNNHNGFITATSVEDRGTTFDIYLPAESLN